MTTDEAIKLFEKNIRYWEDSPIATSVVEADKLAISALRVQQQTNAPLTGWTSVKERHPEDSDRVLTYSFIDGVCTGQYLGDGRWRVKTSYPEKVTHWMPLPEPPKGE